MLLIIFILALILRLIFFDTSYFLWDSSIYMLHGKLFAGLPVGYEELFQRPPLLPFLLSFFAKSAHYEALSTAGMALLNSLIVIPVYLLGRIYSKKTALLAAILIAILPAHIYTSRLVMTDAPAALLALSCLAAYYYTYKKKSWPLAILAGILLSLSIMMKFTNILLIILILPFLFRKQRNLFAISCLTATLAFIPFLVYSASIFGNPFQIMINAFHVVEESHPVPISLMAYFFLDSLSFLLLFALVGLILAARQKGDIILSYWLAISALYFVFIALRGVAKPEGLEFEVERFMLLFLGLAVIFAARGIVFVSNKSRIKSLALILMLIASIPFWAYERAYTPEVEFESGLRKATLDIANFYRQSAYAHAACFGNCPPIAYYSGKNISFVHKNMLSNYSHFISFEEMQGTLLHKTCHQEHCAYFYSQS